MRTKIKIIINSLFLSIRQSAESGRPLFDIFGVAQILPKSGISLVAGETFLSNWT